MPTGSDFSSQNLHTNKNRNQRRHAATHGMRRHISSCMPLGKREVASDSVPPDPEHDAGWAIWNGLSGRESQPHQLGGCLCRIVGDPCNCEMVRVLKIECGAPLNHGRRLVPSRQVAVTRWRGLLLGRLRPAKRTLRVEVLLSGQNALTA